MVSDQIFQRLVVHISMGVPYPPSIFQVLSMTLVLHLALPEELTLPLVLLLALVVVLDLQIPLGPLLYFTVALGACLLYELPPVIGILIHAHLAVLIIVRSVAHTNQYVER